MIVVDSVRDWWRKLPYICRVRDGAIVLGVRPGRRRWFMIVVDDDVDVTPKGDT